MRMTSQTIAMNLRYHLYASEEGAKYWAYPYGTVHSKAVLAERNAKRTGLFGMGCSRSGRT